MPQILKPTQIIRETHFNTTTSQGEVTVNINLTLTVQMDHGELKITPSIKKVDEIPDYIIPEWDEIKPNELIDFGKDVKE
jgi:hypothetical protein